MIVVVDCATSGDAILGRGGEGEEVDSEVVLCAEKLEGVFVIDADFGECAVKDGGDWFVCSQDDAEDNVDVEDVVWGFDSDFFVEMKFMISWRVVYRASSGGNGWVRGIVRCQHSRREMKISYPRWRMVSAFSYSSGPRMVRGPMPSIMNSMCAYMELTKRMVSVTNWEIGGRMVIACMA